MKPAHPTIMTPSNGPRITTITKCQKSFAPVCGSVVERVSEIQSSQAGVDRQYDDALYVLANSHISNG